MIVIDVTRTTVSLRTARRFNSAALLSNALHFGSDLAGSLAVLVGLVFVAGGLAAGDSVAALIVAAMVLSAAVRLMRRNVDVLMDRAPADAEEAARQAIAAIEPPIQLKRLRMRSAAGRHFADVVIAVSPEAAVGQGHAAADAVEAALERALPETDVVVHVEPTEEDAVTRELAYAAAMKVRRVREIHNISVLQVDGRTEVSLHLKLPGDSSLEEAHRVASEVEHAIEEALPGVDTVRTHLEPLAEEAEGRGVAAAADAAAVTRVVQETIGGPPRELRFLETDEGLVVFLTIGLDSTLPLAEAHARASQVEERIRRDLPGRLGDHRPHGAVIDLDLRNRTYAEFVRLGRAPRAEELGPRDEVLAGWARLHDAHALVLDGDEIRMANPFSAVPTPYRVRRTGGGGTRTAPGTPSASASCSAATAGSSIATSSVDGARLPAGDRGARLPAASPARLVGRHRLHLKHDESLPVGGAARGGRRFR